MAFPFFGMFCLVPLSFPCLAKLAVAFSFYSECRMSSVECSAFLLVVVIIADSEA